MAKYHIFEIQVKKADYRSLVSPQMMDKLQEQIMNIIVFQKKYRDKDYSAKKLAEEIGTNTRYISAVVNTRFHMNYTQFVTASLSMLHSSDLEVSLPVNTERTTFRSIPLWLLEESKWIGLAISASLILVLSSFSNIHYLSTN